MNFGVKGQGQIYLEYVLWLITGTPFYVFTEAVPIWHSGCLWCVDWVADMTLESIVKVKYT